MTHRQSKLDRRQAIKAIGLGVGAAAISGQTVQAAPAQADVPSSADSTEYRETQHVLTYYDTLSEKGG
ncbi:twin-arginine translocation signal domain-containing protein [Ferrimonas lipolytica]|uniref:Twin-arginine translocation signal domain-containing protein n=1 Tax=Ferrimonas lipolytica TaxID=2724191 RepID=A0A6H1UG30_9GAMM|nr:twin-arginine translocation signal domain-containing protein [Ferrimonas lipolytica]QIZ78004.1 twin-arginine translocation signal domain-containing protein [Ferrimonas lipolytica]